MLRDESGPRNDDGDVISALVDRSGVDQGDVGQPAQLGRVLLSGAAVGVWVCVAGFAVVAAPTLIAWLGAGATEPMLDVLSVAGAGWLLGLGATLTTADASWGLTPLGLTVISLVLAYRGGLWAADSASLTTGSRAGALLLTATVSAGAVAGVVAAQLSLAAVTVDPGEAASQAGLITASGVALGLLAIGGPWRDSLVHRIPAPLLGSLAPALGAVAVLAVAAAGLTTLAVLGSFGTITSLLNQIDPGAAGVLALLVASLAYLPTLMVWTLEVIIGPGVSLSAQVAVSSSGVDATGPLPGFPLLGVVPESVPGWLPLLGTVTMVVSGLVGGVLVRRRRSSDQGLRRTVVSGGLVGVLVGLGVAVASWSAGGPMGPGDLAQVGGSPALAGAIAAVIVGVCAVLTVLVLEWRPTAHRPSRDLSASLSES